MARCLGAGGPAHAGHNGIELGLDRGETALFLGSQAVTQVLDFNKKMSPNGYYQNKVNGIRLRSDGVHPTAEAVNWLTPWLLDSLNWAVGSPPRR